MDQQERISAILIELDNKERLSVSDICALFDVSRDTARRDIVKLENMGVVERFQGGIRKPYLRPLLEDYRSRLITNPDIKQMLGKAAAKFVHDGDTILLDISATVQFVGENVTAKNVLAVTNSVDTAIALTKTSIDRVYLTGGYLYPQSHALLGMGVLDKVMSFHFDIVFIGASAVRPNGLYYTLEDDIVLKKAAMRTADKIILVADHTKFAKMAPYRMDFGNIDLFVTDRRPPSELEEALQKNEIAVMLVDGDNHTYIE